MSMTSNPCVCDSFSSSTQHRLLNSYQSWWPPSYHNKKTSIFVCGQSPMFAKEYLVCTRYQYFANFSKFPNTINKPFGFIWNPTKINYKIPNTYKGLYLPLPFSFSVNLNMCTWHSSWLMNIGAMFEVLGALGIQSLL